jgi:superoxide dismutase, Cu-Zn family
MMIKMPLALVLAMAASFTAIAGQSPAPRVWTVDGQPPAIGATADIVDLSGKSVGSAQLRQGARGVVIDLQVTGVAPGQHGVHFHAVGTCDAASKFASADHHMGLEAKPHGYLNTKDHHAGDLPNLTVHADGSGSAQFYSNDVRISGKTGKGQMMLLDADGSSLIIHEKADDGFTQPSGGAGGRISCGTIKQP